MGMSWRSINKIIFNSAKKDKLPVAATFELTARCNFQCKMCYLCRQPNDKEAINKELTAEQWLRVAKEARDAGAFFITVTGGEIFIRKDFKQIYEGLVNLGFNITLFTNGSMITDEIAEWLGKIPPSRVSITVYGASPETYEKITGHRDGFERTLRGIEALRKNNILTEIKTTVIKANYNEFNEMIKLANSYEVALCVVNYVAPRREGCCTDPIANRLDPMETALYEHNYEEYNYNLAIEKGDKRLIKEKDSMEEASISKIRTEDKKQEGKAFKCSAGQYAYWLSWDGRMTPCGLLTEPSLDIRESGIKDQWLQLNKECDKIPQCEECEKCSLKNFCMSCPSRLHSETGKFDVKAPYLCETAKCRAELRNIHYNIKGEVK